MGLRALSILCGEAMREPVEPGWTKKQTPAPFFYICVKLTGPIIILADFGVFAGKNYFWYETLAFAEV